MTPGVESSPAPRRSLWWIIIKRTVVLLIAAVAINTVAPLLLDVFGTAGELKGIAPLWFVAMVVLEMGSFAAAWGLTRLAVPGLTWRVAALSQMSSNAASRVLPGGAVLASALYYRMLAGAGIEAGKAAAALTVNSLISTAVLFALPAVAALIAAFSAPVPAGLAPVAVAGVAVFVLLLLVGFVAIRFDAPLRGFTRMVDVGAARLRALRSGTPMPPPDELPDHRATVLARRNEVVGLLGAGWYRALGFAAFNWVLDYMALVAALYAVGARPRLSIVLLAYAAAAVLTMIPLTPGGLGFVEAGLATTLTIAGVAASRSLLATLAYRLVAFWLPIPSGGVAYLIYRRRYGKAAPEPGG